MPEVRLRYFAAARQALGLSEETLSADGGLLGVIGDLSSRSDQAARVLAQCSFVMDGRTHPQTSDPLPDGATIDVLPPFAGG